MCFALELSNATSQAAEKKTQTEFVGGYLERKKYGKPSLHCVSLNLIKIRLVIRRGAELQV